MKVVIPGLGELREVGQDDVGRLFLGYSDSVRAPVTVHLVDRPISSGQHALLAEVASRPVLHRRLLSISEVGTFPGGLTYVVSAVRPGETLAARLVRRALLSAEEAWAVLRDVGEALAALHAAGQTHGAVSPESIVVGPDGYVLVEPGLVAIVSPVPPAAGAPMEGLLARSAPEVLEGGACTVASDVFSLAATVSEMTTGRIPVRWSRGDLVEAVAERWSHPDLVGLPDELRAAVTGALALQPSLRPVAEFVGLGRPQRPSRHRPIKEQVVDEDVQFTVYRPQAVSADRWHSLLVFAHKSEIFSAGADDAVDPVAEVRRRAAQHLGADIDRYRAVSDDSGQALAWGSELRIVPEIADVTFNPPSHTFLWVEPVHQAEFRFRPSPSLVGRSTRGTVSVYFGALLIAEVRLSIRVTDEASEIGSIDSARPYRRIFASYSHRDMDVVQQVESYISTLGDRFLRDVIDLRSGEVWSPRLEDMIREADVFQLFWSSNSMTSPFVTQEWEYALGLERPHFIRPLYWEQPLPARPDEDLPPSRLARLHFSHLPLRQPSPEEARHLAEEAEREAFRRRQAAAAALFEHDDAPAPARVRFGDLVERPELEPAAPMESGGREPATGSPAPARAPSPAPIPPAIPPEPIPPAPAPPAQLPGAAESKRFAPRPDVQRAPPKPGDLVCCICGAGSAPTRTFCRSCGTFLTQAVIEPKLPLWERLIPQTRNRESDSARGVRRVINWVRKVFLRGLRRR